MAGHGKKKAPPTSQAVRGRPSPAPSSGFPPPPPEYSQAAVAAAAAVGAARNSWLPSLAAADCPNYSIPVDWGNDVRPPGGFVNFLQNPSSSPLPHQIPSQPAVSQDAPFVPPPPSAPGKSASGASNKRTKPINVESGDDAEEAKTMKRLTWTSKEDERLISAWLKNSNDSISGNFKKNDKYWGDVTAEYNRNTPPDRQRQVNQAMNRWHRVNKILNNFHAIHEEISRVYTSGQCDKQLMDTVHRAYESRHGAPFLLVSTWEVVRHEPKWFTYNAELNGSKKRDLADLGELGDRKSSATDIGDGDIPRPKGTKAAKAERDGKGKGNLKSRDLEELEKYYEVQKEAAKNRADVLEVQKRIAADKLESSRLILLAAKEKKEAKTKTKMLEQYGKLMTQDLTGMNDVQKAEHTMALKLMREELFPAAR